MSSTSHASDTTRLSHDNVQPSQPARSNSNPLPVLSMTVLSITMLGEFLSANVSAPFILFMVAGFDEPGDDAAIAYWTGILVSVFFITQFLTSLLWATIAEKHGRRLVLFISLLGSALACAAFGTSTSLKQAIAIRLLQGVFAGAIGVARSAVPFITNPSNEGRAYSILGFCWGLGGVAGAIIGGSFESPSSKWPTQFTKQGLFGIFPYLLPCLVASSITVTGALLCIFVGPDGGPRHGRLALPLSEGDGPAELTMFQRWLRQPLATFRLLMRTWLSRDEVTESVAARPPDLNASGRHRLVGTSYQLNTRILQTRMNYASRLDESVSDVRSNSRYDWIPRSNDSNLTQRLLIANEFSVTNMADFWVNAAISADENRVLDEEVEPEFIYEDTNLDMGLDPEYIAIPEVHSHSVAAPGHTRIPRIYRNTGLGFSDRRRLAPQRDSALQRQSSVLLDAPTEGASDLWNQLPIAIILQYGVLALHSTTHDQVFYSYLLSPYSTGGLGLGASNFSQLIAMMCLAQIAYQFYLYPNVGPPRGRFSHLTMFRIGSALFIPAYLSVIAYRVLGDRGGDAGIWPLMLLLALSTAIRYCAITFSYTSIAILLNYLAPRKLNGLANGIAQSIVSLARFVGPITGGYLWSASVDGSPSGYPFGFLIVSLIAAAAIAHSFSIR